MAGVIVSTFRRATGAVVATATVLGAGVLAPAPGRAAVPAPAPAAVGPVLNEVVAAAPLLPRIAGVDAANRSPDDPAGVPAAGSATTGVWTVWTGLGRRSTATRMSMPPAAGRALLGDWNGDGIATPGRFDGGQWFVTNAAVNTAVWEPYASFGGDPADIPVTGRIDKDRRTDIGVFRNGTWLWQRANGKPAATDEFGAAGDIPVVGDWDGDGRDDIGVVRGGAWILRITGTSRTPSWVGPGVQVQQHPESDAVVLTFPYGLASDIPVVGDWDGDGRDDPGAVRGGRDWYLSRGLGRVLKTTHEIHTLTGDEVALVGGQATKPGHCPTATRAGERYGIRLASYVRPATVPRGRVGMAGGRDILATVEDGLRYAVTDALTVRLAGRTSRPYYDPLSTDAQMEEAIRRSANATLAAAIMLRTTRAGEVDGISRAQLLDFARWNIRSLACQHGASSPGGWGNDWQSALWATTTGQAGWLLWPHLNREERGLVAAMVVSEAEYAAARGPRYWTNRLGQVTKPGDSQSDEVSWDLTAPALALAMMPTYGSAGKWRSSLIAMAIAAFARPDDIHRAQTVNGVRVDIRIPGTNANEDGTVTNHGIVNPDYTQNVEHLWWAATILRSGDRRPAGAGGAVLQRRHRVPRALAGAVHGAAVRRPRGHRVPARWPDLLPDGRELGQPQAGHLRRRRRLRQPVRGEGHPYEELSRRARGGHACHAAALRDREDLCRRVVRGLLPTRARGVRVAADGAGLVGWGVEARTGDAGGPDGVPHEPRRRQGPAVEGTARLRAGRRGRG